MKKISFYICLCTLLVASACKQETIGTYNNDNSKTAIYFAEAKSVSNQKFVSFGYSKTTVADSVVTFIVRQIGEPVNHDRVYNLTIADSSGLKKGTDYQILNTALAIKAGKVADTLKIKLLRNPAMRAAARSLYMDLKPNENFTNDYLSYNTTTNGVVSTNYYTRMALKADDIAGPPPFWTVGSSYYSYTFGYLGAFSMLKFQLLITTYNLDVNELIVPTWFTANGNYVRLGGWADGLKSYLTRMAAAGTPVYEADGVTLMTMGVNAK
ncbi:DUF4843 domain-containing protein [Mucilaginibacter mali]|uniref:DUF4843 domain-containing protein n=1 Tax=Mucilaginibacter mali TaxID=2740462 RepID=A0A7D4PWW0_9SPHI|nr:DUF4843 domain-containing protein [Mucilaginibacter mali]QKJ32808.1 DUF4843 domain-containing protein [Mucilaginibacter mali]